MRTDFTPDNVELWISNWKRKELIDSVVREWLDSFDFERVNVIANHSSVTIEDFGRDIVSKIVMYDNVMRHDNAIGPMNENYNQAYVHTFLGGKRYCICAHDNMYIDSGWVDIVKNTDYDLYMAPQGDQIHIITLEGLQTYGWWDERYATNGNHELDYIVRALRVDILGGVNKSSMVDYHGWHGWPLDKIDLETEDGSLFLADSPIVTEGHPEFGGFPYLKHNSVGLENVWRRMDKGSVPQTGPKTDKFVNLDWNDRKWRGMAPNVYNNFVEGAAEDEVDWYPWLDVQTLEIDKCKIV